MTKIHGIEGRTPALLRQEIRSGGKFVVYLYCISLVIVTFKRSSDVYFIPAGESAVGPGWGYTLLSLLMGWWGIPWGPIRTIEALTTNLTGGKDVTAQVEDSLFASETRSSSQMLAAHLQREAAHRGTAVGRVKCSGCGLEIWEGYEKCWKCGTPLPKTNRNQK